MGSYRIAVAANALVAGALVACGVGLGVCAGGCSGSSGGDHEGAPQGPDGSVATHDDAAAIDADAGAEASVPEEAAADDASPADAGADARVLAAGDGGRDYSTDTSTFLGASRCADAGVQLCEDFESGNIDPAIWSVSSGSSTKPVIDGVQHARGTHALHITQSGNGYQFITEKMTFPEANNTYFGRVFVYFKSLPTPPGMDYAHWTMIAGSGSGVPGEIRVSGQLQSGKNLWGVGTDNRTDAGTGDWTNSDNDPKNKPLAVPLNQWLCIEWMHKGDTNETQFWWDGALHPSLSTTASMHGGNTNPYLLPQFKQVWLGWQEYQDSTEPFELWLDEIAIDSRRIGCVL
jgi:hypothetical protein